MTRSTIFCTARLSGALLVTLIAPARMAASTITWPGEMDGPASLYVTPSTLVLFGTFGIADIPPAIVETDLPSTTTTKTTQDNSTQGSIQQLGQTRITETMWSSAGRLHVQVEVVGEHTYTAARTGLVGRQSCTALGYIQILPCPNPEGVADGSISLALRQETTKADGSVTAAVTTAQGGFSFLDGDDAYRTTTKLELTITEGARRSTSEADTGWAAPVSVRFEWPRRGDLTVTPIAPETWSWAGEVPEDAFKSSAAQLLTQKVLQQLEAPVEAFWRAGHCIKLRTNEGTGHDVDSGETLTLTVEAKHKLDDQDVEAPIKAEFSGVKSLEPTGVAVDPPADFDFTAGPNENDRGLIKLIQTGKRGIGKEEVTFRVKPGDLLFSMESTFVLATAAGAGELHWTLQPTKLVKQADGSYRGRGALQGGLKMQGADGSATGAGLGEIEIIAKPDEANRTRFLVTINLGATSVGVTGTSRRGGRGSGAGTMPGISGAQDHPITLGEPITLTPNPGLTLKYSLVRAPARR